MGKISRAAAVTALGVALAGPPIASGAESGGLVGVGVRSCDDLRSAEASAGRGEDDGVLSARRYEDWTAGFVSGLNLAAGRDLLRNVPFSGFMRRVADHCADHPGDDVFTAVNARLRQINAPDQD